MDLDVEIIVLEATGKFHRRAHRSLADDGFAVAVLNPYRSRKFSDALGELAKTDEIDARVLAKTDIQGEAVAKKMPTLQSARVYHRPRSCCRLGPPPSRGQSAQ